MNGVDLEGIARALGGATRQGRGWLAFCPSHDNTRTPALSLDIGNNGNLLVSCHSGCDGRAVLDALRGRGLIEGRANGDGVAVDPVEAAKREKERRAKEAQMRGFAISLWSAAQPGEGTPVATYLREARGIDLDVIPPSLRFHPAIKHPSGVTLPAMVAIVENVRGEGIGIHRTFLRADGMGKADIQPSKAMLGPVRGGAVRFSRDRETMAVAEGIESALSFAVATRTPTLAVLSTSGMKAVGLPAMPLASSLIVAADNDPAGLMAGRILARRAVDEGRAARVIHPPVEGEDFNDLLLRPESEGAE